MGNDYLWASKVERVAKVLVKALFSERMTDINPTLTPYGQVDGGPQFLF